MHRLSSLRSDEGGVTKIRKGRPDGSRPEAPPTFGRPPRVYYAEEAKSGRRRHYSRNFCIIRVKPVEGIEELWSKVVYESLRGGVS